MASYSKGLEFAFKGLQEVRWTCFAQLGLLASSHLGLVEHNQQQKPDETALTSKLCANVKMEHSEDKEKMAKIEVRWF